MSISVFDLFSIGIGPSSSHAVGPMRAAKKFVESIGDELNNVTRVEVTLYGSLAFTGEGHGTNKSILMGLEGEEPATIDPEGIPARIQSIKDSQTINLLSQYKINFHIDQDLIFNFKEMLPYYSNGMRYKAFNNEKLIKQEDYYSVGGGFIVTAEEITNPTKTEDAALPYPFETAKELLTHCEKNNASIADIILENEKVWRSEEEIKQGILNIADVMEASINRGIRTEGILEEGLNVRRRARALYKKVLELGDPGPDHPQTMNWLNLYAMAVNEENAAGGRVVTAPTNGAAGIIPAVLRYYKAFCRNYREQGVIDLLLTAGAIGILYKKNASISGAEMGCQGEVGVACSMAAGGLAAALQGTVHQVENAAEIGMEHNLGLTCDPVNGLVQIPCIERNAMGAVKAVNAARLALAEAGEHKVTLDMVINTMREIGENMNTIYKETSKGGLAVNVPEC
ncbi:MAG: L-serine ammonia-lyase [Coxiellaceae bacterium]|nr:L-serine ammonia-lyase [Coxiellaceae bacterium]